MTRIVKSMEDKYREVSLPFVEKVFSEWSDEEEGKLVRRLVEEIRSKKYYIPELELIMVNEEDEVIGYAMFSRFHLEGKYEDELLIITPVAVKTELQRQHISKDIIEYGIEAAESIHLLHPDCLMVKELEDGALEHISGMLDYSFYECLR